MLKAVLRQGVIVPLEPLPQDWEEGAALEVAKAHAPRHRGTPSAGQGSGSS